MFIRTRYDEHTDIDIGHGRIETITCQQILVDKSRLSKGYRWSGLKSIVKISSEAHEKLTGKNTQETRWYISSLRLNAEQVLHAVRSHWQVESMHRLRLNKMIQNQRAWHVKRR